MGERALSFHPIDSTFQGIALPTQSIAVEKDDTVPTNKRRQTFSDILSLLKHYSAGTRKDAIFSARELFQDHPGLLERSIAPLLGACVRLVGDEARLQPHPSLACLTSPSTGCRRSKNVALIL